MLSETAQAVRKVQGSITFDLGSQLEKKLHSHLEGTCSHLLFKFHEHPTKIDFIGTYRIFKHFQTFNGQLSFRG